MVATRRSTRVAKLATAPPATVRPTKREIKDETTDDEDLYTVASVATPDSDVPLVKRRRTRNKPTSEVVSPAASFGSSRDGTIDTPATSMTDGFDDEEKAREIADSVGDESDEVSEYESGNNVIDDDECELDVPEPSKKASRPKKAAPKKAAPKKAAPKKAAPKKIVAIKVEIILDSGDDESEFESEDSDFEPVPKRKSDRKGKGKAIEYDEEEEESDLNTEDEEDEYTDSEDNAAAPVPPPPAHAAPTVPRGTRPAFYGAEHRAARDRENLYLMHPELRTIWADLAERPTIPVEEDPQPEGLSLTLLPFQKEGLHWMRLQEQGSFHGGILADEMGMGKTIQTLSLIMIDPNSKPNLVVVPTVAIMQWRSEVEKYTGQQLKVYVYHGATRISDHKELQKYNIILTTYNILESVFRKQVSGHKRKDGLYKEASALHKINYHRVILDEAHNIKDRSCNTAKAAFALKTKYKLCLSGTPLQNRIGELFSLLRFLEVDPFAYYYCRKCPCKQLHWKFTDKRTCDHCHHAPMSHLCFFNYDCLKPIQNYGNEGAGRTAFKNIHKLMKHIMLRRTKHEREEDLGLPPKVVRIRRDKFAEEELDLYDSIYSDGKRKFDTYVAQGVLLNNYANIFTLITRMRQMADHPDLILRRHSEDSQNTLVCMVCDDEAEDPIKSKCHHTFCRDCVQRYISGYDSDSDPECPKCHIPLIIDLTQPALDVDTPTTKKNSIISRIDMTKWRSSTKIEALCEELYKLRSPHQTTKSIVFSQFTSMLQLIEWRLNRAGFKTVMLEGSMTPSQREATINHFMNNVDVEVFLVSLKAGGVALNLIEANQVFLMEPWWNPSVEWQAADRIHRIGQTRVCRITRMVIQDSIESRIVELQEKKTRMIEATVNGDEKAMEKLTPDDMEFLFQN